MGYGDVRDVYEAGGTHDRTGTWASGLRDLSDVYHVLDHVDPELEQLERQQALLFASTEPQYHGTVTSPIARLQTERSLSSSHLKRGFQTVCRASHL
jgi:hypothetical protein